MLGSAQLILSTAYNPPIQYFAGISRHSQFLIEVHENYLKQSYRNRCRIMTANGPLDLVIPVRRLGGKIPVTMVQIDNEYKWQVQHWRTIVSAYRNSPFFEYYENEFLPFYQEKYDNLFAYNSELLEKFLDLTGINFRPGQTSEFIRHYSGEICDLRYKLHPKKPSEQLYSGYQAIPYQQVFEERFSFTPGLSILDLIFNTGPSAGKYL